MGGAVSGEDHEVNNKNCRFRFSKHDDRPSSVDVHRCPIFPIRGSPIDRQKTPSFANRLVGSTSGLLRVEKPWVAPWRGGNMFTICTYVMSCHVMSCHVMSCHVSMDGWMDG